MSRFVSLSYDLRYDRIAAVYAVVRDMKVDRMKPTIKTVIVTDFPPLCRLPLN